MSIEKQYFWREGESIWWGYRRLEYYLEAISAQISDWFKRKLIWVAFRGGGQMENMRVLYTKMYKFK